MPEGRRQELKTEKTWVTKRMLPAIMVLLCLLLVSGVCFLAAKLIWEQGQDVAVSVDTSGKEYTERVTVTVSNVLGMDLLLDERDHSCAMLQFYGEAGWEDVCEIRFVREDCTAISAKYGGMFAHLRPGEELTYCLQQEELESLQSGEYRIAIRYLIEDEYTRFLRAYARQLEHSFAAESSVDASEPESRVESGSSGSPDRSNVEGSAPDFSSEESGDMVPPALQPNTQLFYKTFRLVGRSDVSGDSSATESAEESADLDVSVWVK